MALMPARCAWLRAVATSVLAVVVPWSPALSRPVPIPIRRRTPDIGRRGHGPVAGHRRPDRPGARARTRPAERCGGDPTALVQVSVSLSQEPIAEVVPENAIDDGTLPPVAEQRAVTAEVVQEQDAFVDVSHRSRCGRTGTGEPGGQRCRPRTPGRRGGDPGPPPRGAVHQADQQVQDAAECRRVRQPRPGRFLRPGHLAAQVGDHRPRRAGGRAGHRYRLHPRRLRRPRHRCGVSELLLRCRRPRLRCRAGRRVRQVLRRAGSRGQGRL